MLMKFKYFPPSLNMKSAIALHFRTSLFIPSPGIILDSFISFTIHAQAFRNLCSVSPPTQLSWDCLSYHLSLEP